MPMYGVQYDVSMQVWNVNEPIGVVKYNYPLRHLEAPLALSLSYFEIHNKLIAIQ